MSREPAITDLEARALWHLAIGYEPEPPTIDADDDYDDSDYMGRVSCWQCGGEGFVIVCCDDLCHGAGYCMHGDGHMTCSQCHGEGAC